ncbi:MAG: hypothetical protein HYW07_16865 [Candidatus Latescibacteria bacterium]|nr:hypothetical protein [Candidatus Latescibacterota bacterium]
MNEDDRTIPSGPFKGKKIEIAPSKGMEMFADVAEEFMERILGFAPGDYLITDESSLTDFIGLGEEVELTDLQQKIREEYEVEISDLPSGNLLEIFMRIHRRKYGPPA